MRPDEFDEAAESSRHRGGMFELFFYEQVGTRYYLRFTRLALVLVICLTVIPVVAIFTLFLTQSHADLKNVNIDVRAPERAPGNYPQQLIKQQPSAIIPTPPKAGRSPRGGESARQTPAAPGQHANSPPTPTPSPTPSRPPG